ncbi:MAG: hypothetical protein ACETWG_03870 [Candidatus Neomarinimicrobiota bacterium]
MIVIVLQASRVGSPVLGVIIPLVVFVVSFIVTWALYKHFSRRV